MSEDDKPIWRELGKTVEGFMRDELEKMKEKAPIPSWKQPIFVDWYFTLPPGTAWCWIDPFGNGYGVPSLIRGRGYAPKLPMLAGRDSKHVFFCDCGEVGCTGGLIVD